MYTVLVISVACFLEVITLKMSTEKSTPMKFSKDGSKFNTDVFKETLVILCMTIRHAFNCHFKKLICNTKHNTNTPQYTNLRMYVVRLHNENVFEETLSDYSH